MAFPANRLPPVGPTEMHNAYKHLCISVVGPYSRVHYDPDFGIRKQRKSITLMWPFYLLPYLTQSVYTILNDLTTKWQHPFKSRVWNEMPQY